MMESDDYIFGPYDKAEKRARKAFELYENGAIPEALILLDKALEINPANATWHFDRGLALDAMNRFDEAIEEYQTAIQHNPNDVEMLNSLAVDYTRCGHYDLALSTFSFIQQLDPDFEPSYCNRIITYTEIDRHDLAEEMFYMAQQIDPDCALCFYNMGNSLFVRGKYEKAIGCWERTLELEPSHPQINYRIAQAQWASGNLDQAREYFLCELRNDPGQIEAILDFGILLIQLGDIPAAREKFNRIIELDPEFAAAHFYLGELEFAVNDFSKAKEHYHRAIMKDSSQPGVRFRLSQIAFENDDLERAESLLNEELHHEQEDADVLTSIGSMYLILGKTSFAVGALLRALELDCAHADAYYYLGLASTMQKRWDEARDFFNHALDIRPEHIDALCDSAIILASKGKQEEALDRILKAKELDENDKKVHQALRLIQSSALYRGILDFTKRFKPTFLR